MWPKYELYERICSLALELGFIKIGFIRSTRPIYWDELIKRCSSGFYEGMEWLHRSAPIRQDPTMVLSNCKTIICLAYPYMKEKPSTPEGYTVSRFSEPHKKDYHIRIKELCKKIVELISRYQKGERSRICVDSAPIMERSLANMAGLGFFGKNTSLIIPGYGSYFFLAEILTTADIYFESDPPLDTTCGSCENCLNICKQQALIKPYCLDPRLCLSYLTIEDKREIDKKLGRNMDRCFYGCDLCQEACPHNPKPDNGLVSLPPIDYFIQMDEITFKKEYGQTALARAGLKKIKSNISAMLGFP